MVCQYKLNCDSLQHESAVSCRTCGDAVLALVTAGGSQNSTMLRDAGLCDAANVLDGDNITVWEGAICAHTNLTPVGLCHANECYAWIDSYNCGNCYRVLSRHATEKVTGKLMAYALQVPQKELKQLSITARAAIARMYLATMDVRNDSENLVMSPYQIFATFKNARDLLPELLPTKSSVYLDAEFGRRTHRNAAYKTRRAGMATWCSQQGYAVSERIANAIDAIFDPMWRQ